jgi:hypothetical protein
VKGTVYKWSKHMLIDHIFSFKCETLRYYIIYISPSDTSHIHLSPGDQSCEPPTLTIPH